jgi:hypothetical protein
LIRLFGKYIYEVTKLLEDGISKMTDRDREEFLRARKKAALCINPETAEVDWVYGQTMDPYGIDPDLPDELQCIERIYFVRSRGSDPWVCFYDLSEEICSALWKKHRQNLAFPTALSLAPEQDVNLNRGGDETR